MTLHKGYADWIFIYMTKNTNFAEKTEPSTEETTGENNNNSNAVINTVKYENLTPGKEYTIHGVLYKTSGESLAESSTTFIPETPDGETQLTYTVDVDDEATPFEAAAAEWLEDNKEHSDHQMTEIIENNNGDVPRSQNNNIITLIAIFIGCIVFGLLLYRCIKKSNANKQEPDDNIYDDAEDNYNDKYDEDYRYDDYIVDITTRNYTLLNGKKQN